MSKNLMVHKKMNSMGMIHAPANEVRNIIGSIAAISVPLLSLLAIGFSQPVWYMGIWWVTGGLIGTVIWISVASAPGTAGLPLGIPKILTYRKITSLLNKSGIKSTRTERKAIFNAIDCYGSFEQHEYHKLDFRSPYFDINSKDRKIFISEKIAVKIDDIFFKAITLKNSRLIDEIGSTKVTHEMSKVDESAKGSILVRELIENINSKNQPMRFVKKGSFLSLTNAKSESAEQLAKIRKFYLDNLASKFS